METKDIQKLLDYISKSDLDEVNKKLAIFQKKIESSKDYSEKMAEKLDDHIKSLLQERYEIVKIRLEEYRGCIESIVATLMEHETIDGEKLITLIEEFETAIRSLAGNKTKWQAFRDVIHKDGRISAKLFTRRASVMAVPMLFHEATGDPKAKEKKEKKYVMIQLGKIRDLVFTDEGKQKRIDGVGLMQGTINDCYGFINDIQAQHLKIHTIQ
jgi:hypothetical protein